MLPGTRAIESKCKFDKNLAMQCLEEDSQTMELIKKNKRLRMYGLLERQFRNYYLKLLNLRVILVNLLNLLETRLDNVVYRMGFALLELKQDKLFHKSINVNGKGKYPFYNVKQMMKYQ